jgi:hypothetical protein
MCQCRRARGSMRCVVLALQQSAALDCQPIVSQLAALDSSVEGVGTNVESVLSRVTKTLFNLSTPGPVPETAFTTCPWQDCTCLLHTAAITWHTARGQRQILQLHTSRYAYIRCCVLLLLQVVREILPDNKVNLTITVPAAICQEGFAETVKVMRRCGLQLPPRVP